MERAISQRSLLRASVTNVAFIRGSVLDAAGKPFGVFGVVASELVTSAGFSPPGGKLPLSEWEFAQSFPCRRISCAVGRRCVAFDDDEMK